jgi:Glycosyl transferase family 2
VHITHRREPAFAWFADSLAAQLEPGDQLEVIFVDGLHDGVRAAELERIVAGRFRHRHVAPKPTPWNGPHRLTRRDYAALASARNTGIVYASAPYIAFVDDLCVLMPGWLDQLREAARRGEVAAGAYQKRYEMVVRDGALLSSRLEPDGLDCRWERGEERAAVPIGGAELFGAGTAAPRELLVALNGYDEICDPVGGEDYHLGLRIEWTGTPISYRRSMLVVESQELHRQPGLARHGKSADEATYMRRLREYGVAGRSTDGPFDISHMILDILLGTRALRTIGNHYSLAALTEHDLADTAARLPRTHWFDHQPLGGL